MKTYAAFSKNQKERLESSSGGIFSLMAKYIFSKHGVVYGISLTKDCKAAEYKRVTNSFGLDKLRGSKYFQAKVGDVYKNVEKDLKNGLEVLFTGTACQVNGLKKYLGKEYTTLYCVDIVCHGVPSPKLWRKYIDYVEKKYKDKILNIQFRCKDLGWYDYGMKEFTCKKNFFIPKEENPFMLMFLKDYCLRPSCYNCLAKQNKLSDLTIGDFWGIEDILPEMNDNKGVSLVIIRTEKGKQLFTNIQNYTSFRSVTYEEAIRSNPFEHTSVSKPPERNSFFHDMNRMRFEELKKKYVIIQNTSIRERTKKKIKILLKKGVGFGREKREDDIK